MGCGDYTPLTTEQSNDLALKQRMSEQERDSRIAAFEAEMDTLLRQGLRAGVRELTAIIYDEHLPDRGEIHEAARRVFLSGKYEMDGISRVGHPTAEG